MLWRLAPVRWLAIAVLALFTLLVADCARAQPIFADGFEGTGGAPLPTCFTDTDPLNVPVGYAKREVSWEFAFYGNSFPEVDAGGLAPTGSFTFRRRHTQGYDKGVSMAGTYIAIPFTANGAHKIKWFRAQSVRNRKYNARPADAVYVTVTPCAGDFRLPDFGADGELSEKCRVFSPNGSIFFGIGALCPITAGFVNIVFADPFAGLPTATTCAAPNAPYCDANFGD